MLPSQLNALLKSLLALRSPTAAQARLIQELQLVSQILEVAGRSEQSISESLEKSASRVTAAWGAAPGRCPVCGK